MLKAKWSLLIVIFFIGVIATIYFSSCGNDKPLVPETKKETKSQVASSESKIGPKGILLNGHIAFFGKDVVQDIENPDDSTMKYRSDLPVYAACQDAGRGNGFMNSASSNLWDLYKLSFDSLREVYVLDQPDKNLKPLMFTLCQVLKADNGATKVIWLQLERYESSGYVYDNRAGKNRRLVFGAEGYQPETIGGKEVPFKTTNGKYPAPDLGQNVVRN